MAIQWERKRDYEHAHAGVLELYAWDCGEWIVRSDDGGSLASDETPCANIEAAKAAAISAAHALLVQALGELGEA